MSPAPPKWTPPATPPSPMSKEPAPVPDPPPAPPAPPTTTTTVEVTTTTSPSQTAVRWYDSMKFRAYAGSWFTLVIGWAIENITTHQWDFGTYTWIALTVSTLLLVKSVVADWMSPTVVAPFAAMNKNNVPDGTGK